MWIKVWIVINIQILSGVFSECPLEDIFPCRCTNNSLACGGHFEEKELEHCIETLNKQLSEKDRHFSSLTLSGTSLTSLPKNGFKDLTFDSIKLIGNEKLRRIDKDTFTKTNFVTKSITFTYNPNLNQDPSDFFDAMSKFVNLEEILIESNGFDMKEIPSNAFRPLNGYQRNLTSITFGEGTLHSIGKRAFYYLNNLRNIRFHHSDNSNHQNTFHISEYAFEFEEKSNNRLKLTLFMINSLKPLSFSVNSLSLMRRPTNISIDFYHRISSAYLDERVFLPFALQDDNYLNNFFVHIECTDCRNAWLKTYSSLIKKDFVWFCQRGNSFDDPDNFDHCGV